MSTNPKIAFLGLGAMGFGMASSLTKMNHPVCGFDIYSPTLERFRALGPNASTSSSPKETVKDAHFIVFMVATAAQIHSCLFEGPHAAISGLEKGAVIMLCSTGPPEYSPEIQRLLNEAGREDVSLVDAPVSGGTIRASNGTLTILASGTEASLSAARPVLEDMAGPNLWIIPGGLGAGTKVKMVHQVLAGIHILMTSEAMAFAAAMGLNTKETSELVKGSESGSFMFENRTPHMLVEDEKVYSALNIILKDIGIVTAGGRAANFPLFLAGTTEQVLLSGYKSGLGLIDDAALVRVYLPQQPDLVLELASKVEGKKLVADHPRLKLVKQAMTGVHLAAAAEAMCFGQKIGLDTSQLYEIIAKAAGSSAVFVERAKNIFAPNPQSPKKILGVIAELQESLKVAQELKFPLHLTSTALQMFQTAALGHRDVENLPDLAILELFGKGGR